MDLNFLRSYLVPTIVGICLCVGYIIKTSIPKIPNNSIPMILALLGLCLNIFMYKYVNPDIILGGLFSGLASTGLYETFRNMVGKN